MYLHYINVAYLTKICETTCLAVVRRRYSWRWRLALELGHRTVCPTDSHRHLVQQIQQEKTKKQLHNSRLGIEATEEHSSTLTGAFMCSRLRKPNNFPNNSSQQPSWDLNWISTDYKHRALLVHQLRPFRRLWVYTNQTCLNYKNVDLERRRLQRGRNFRNQEQSKDMTKQRNKDRGPNGSKSGTASCEEILMKMSVPADTSRTVICLHKHKHCLQWTDRKLYRDTQSAIIVTAVLYGCTIMAVLLK
jgi:hypothetical protein